MSSSDPTLQQQQLNNQLQVLNNPSMNNFGGRNIIDQQQSLQQQVPSQHFGLGPTASLLPAEPSPPSLFYVIKPFQDESSFEIKVEKPVMFLCWNDLLEFVLVVLLSKSSNILISMQLFFDSNNITTRIPNYKGFDSFTDASNYISSLLLGSSSSGITTTTTTSDDHIMYYVSSAPLTYTPTEHYRQHDNNNNNPFPSSDDDDDDRGCCGFNSNCNNNSKNNSSSKNSIVLLERPAIFLSSTDLLRFINDSIIIKTGFNNRQKNNVGENNNQTPVVLHPGQYLKLNSNNNNHNNTYYKRFQDFMEAWEYLQSILQSSLLLSEESSSLPQSSGIQQTPIKPPAAATSSSSTTSQQMFDFKEKQHPPQKTTEVMWQVTTPSSSTCNSNNKPYSNNNSTKGRGGDSSSFSSTNNSNTTNSSMIHHEVHYSKKKPPAPFNNHPLFDDDKYDGNDVSSSCTTTTTTTTKTPPISNLNKKLKNDSKSDDKDTKHNRIIISEPGPMDIVSGRGKRWANHLGHIQFQNLLQEHRNVYDSSVSKKEKSAICQLVYEKLKSIGCRFLMEYNKTCGGRGGAGGGYIVVTEDKVARSKISFGFRNLDKAPPTIGFRHRLAFQLIHNQWVPPEQVEEEQRRSKRTKTTATHHCQLVALPAHKKFQGANIVDAEGKYPRKTCFCGKHKKRTYCPCTPGTLFCDECYVDHVTAVLNSHGDTGTI